MTCCLLFIEITYKLLNLKELIRVKYLLMDKQWQNWSASTQVKNVGMITKYTLIKIVSFLLTLKPRIQQLILVNSLWLFMKLKI